jgi:hypothetical protein
LVERIEKRESCGNFLASREMRRETACAFTIEIDEEEGGNSQRI